EVVVAADLAVTEREHVGIGGIEVPSAARPGSDPAGDHDVVAGLDPQLRVELEGLEMLRYLGEDAAEDLVRAVEPPVCRDVLGFGLDPFHVRIDLVEHVLDITASEGLVHGRDHASVLGCWAAGRHAANLTDGTRLEGRILRAVRAWPGAPTPRSRPTR